MELDRQAFLQGFKTELQKEAFVQAALPVVGALGTLAAAGIGAAGTVAGAGVSALGSALAPKAKSTQVPPAPKPLIKPKKPTLNVR